MAEKKQDREEECDQVFVNKAFDRIVAHYRVLGRTDEWISARIQALAARMAITDQWEQREK